MKRYIRSSGLGVGDRTVYYLIDYPDREPIRNIDTGAKYYFDTREEAEQFIEDNPYFQEKYPGLSVTSKKEYSVYHPGVNAATEFDENAEFGPQTFKLAHSAYGKTTYESELFKIYKYSTNTPGTSWKSSGYELDMKKHRNWPYQRKKFDTLKEAKEYLNTDSAQKWYKENKKIEAATEVGHWTDYLSNDVYRRLQACRTIKDDLPELVNAKWRFMKSQGKDKQGFVKEDALIAVLELLDANSCDRVADLTVDEYEELKR